MTNNLLDRDGAGAAEEARAAADIPPEETGEAGLPKLPGTPPAPEETPAREEPEPTVFAPSPWERRRTEGEAPDGQAEKEARRREKAAQREAQRMEKQLAQDQRKTQEEARRREAREREEERRREARLRSEEQREEKARQGRVRRVGTMTLGVSLIAIGVAILMYMINPGFDVRVVAYLAPVILISLGAEVLIRYFFSKDRTYKYDFASGIICIFLVIGSFGVSLLPYLAYYIGPERFASEEELLAGQQEKVYRAFTGDQRVRDYSVNGGIDHSLASVRRDEDDRWIYQLNYLYINVYLLDGYPDEAAFARTCRDLADKLMAQGVDLPARHSSYLSFHCGENEEGVSYDLDLSNRLQLEMDAATLAKLVEATYTKPSIENGWYPGGYEELVSDFGTLYADHFARLLEDYGVDCAATYHSLLYNYDDEVAERYYEGILAESSEGRDLPDQSETDEPPAPEEAPPAPSEPAPEEGGSPVEIPPAAEGESAPAAA